jgi:hypothetical protein
MLIMSLKANKTGRDAECNGHAFRVKKTVSAYRRELVSSQCGWLNSLKCVNAEFTVNITEYMEVGES